VEPLNWTAEPGLPVVHVAPPVNVASRDPTASAATVPVPSSNG